MLKNFWYACERSAAIASQPKRVAMLDREFVLYRNALGKLVALDDRCPHRGAALSDGRIEENCLRCPYHGWKYRADGECIEIPANQPEVPVPKNARVKAYPVREEFGWVWLFFGDLPEAERPPLPELPEFGDNSWRPVYGDFEWEAHYTRVIENLLDISHVPFIHANSFGSGMAGNPQIQEYEVLENPWSAIATVNLQRSQKTRGIWKWLLNQKAPPTLGVTLTFYLPNITKLEFQLPVGGFKFIIFSAHLPIASNATRSQWIALRNFITAPWADGDARRRTLTGFREDKQVVESQRPKVVPPDLASEVHVPSDALSIAYRQLRKKYLDLGWGLESNLGAADAANGGKGIEKTEQILHL